MKASDGKLGKVFGRAWGQAGSAKTDPNEDDASKRSAADAQMAENVNALSERVGEISISLSQMMSQQKEMFANVVGSNDHMRSHLTAVHDSLYLHLVNLGNEIEQLKGNLKGGTRSDDTVALIRRLGHE
ncbi:hypothetical protein sos41_14800 [Alphaproteobacteria bacterium SO-S41]|nr:hypothetical protein sos41_14800 [Alphaproteobacteria bacterium SO-S41]